MLRWLATLVIAALFALVVALPSIPLMRRGSESAARSEVPAVAEVMGRSLPDLALVDLAGQALPLSDFRGKRVLLTFERSVEW